MASSRRLWATSDLHISYAENRRLVEERLLPRADGDWLIVAGDVSETVEDIEWALGLLATSLIARRADLPAADVVRHALLTGEMLVVLAGLMAAATLALLAALFTSSVRVGGRSFTTFDMAALGAIAALVLVLVQDDGAAAGGSGALLLAPGLALFVAAQPASAQDIAESHLAAARSAIAALNATDQFDGILPQAAQALKAELIQKNPDLQADIIAIVDQVAFSLAARRPHERSPGALPSAFLPPPVDGRHRRCRIHPPRQIQAIDLGIVDYVLFALKGRDVRVSSSNTWYEH